MEVSFIKSFLLLFIASVNHANCFVVPRSSANKIIRHHGSHADIRTERFLSDVPREKNTNEKEEEDIAFSLGRFLPPPPEDQFIMTGDIAVLFLYCFTGHDLDDFLVNSVFDQSESAREAILTLDPLQEIVRVQTPVWLDTSAGMSPQAVDQVISMNAQETLHHHWAPLLSSAGSSSVALCICWLLAGYLHRAFLFQNTLDCDTSIALKKTLETWISTVLLMSMLIVGTNALFGGCDNCFEVTSSDMTLMVDSASVLFAWRYMANIIGSIFR